MHGRGCEDLTSLLKDRPTCIRSTPPSPSSLVTTGYQNIRKFGTMSIPLVLVQERPIYKDFLLQGLPVLLVPIHHQAIELLHIQHLHTLTHHLPIVLHRLTPQTAMEQVLALCLAQQEEQLLDWPVLITTAVVHLTITAILMLKNKNK